MNIVVLGQPGIGKGTYTDLLAKRYKMPRISTGDMFREEIKKNTKIGKKVKSYVNSGGLVPDEITIPIILKRLSRKDCKNGFFLDGYPRTVPQAEKLETFIKIDRVLNFVASEKVIIERLSGRRVCRKCGSTFHVKNMPPKSEGVCDNCSGELYQREDDTPEAIRVRNREYLEKTKPLIDFYVKRGILANIDANPPIEEVKKVISKCDRELSKIKKKL
jgi:adenylate kinase